MENKDTNVEIYVDNGNIGKKSMIFRVVILNLIFMTICFISSQLILIKKGVSYAKNNPFLYEIVNPTTNEDKLLVFKGEAENNYLKYNNLIWRIIRVNSSGTITVILNDSLNMLPWELGDDYDIKTYLNQEFLPELDDSLLVDNNLCSDSILDYNDLSCNETDTAYVSLLDIHSFINSISDEKTFIAHDKDIIWLNNKHDNKAWHTNGNKISYSSLDSIYQIKPVITLKNTLQYRSGDGTIDNPYEIQTTKLTIGSIVKLRDDLYMVYSLKNEIRLVSMASEMLSYNYDGDMETIFSYLNNDYYQNLSYKSIVKYTDWEITSMNDNSLEKKTVKSYAGFQSLMDFKLSNVSDYYLASTFNKYILIYDTPIIYGHRNTKHFLRPCITISKDMIGKLELYDGIFIARDL